MKRLKADLVSATGAILEFLGQYPKRPILLAIDGRCGSGKTTLAGALEKEAGAAVVHMDHFFLRAARRKEEFS